jgi:hypothetical protein
MGDSFPTSWRVALDLAALLAALAVAVCGIWSKEGREHGRNDSGQDKGKGIFGCCEILTWVRRSPRGRRCDKRGKRTL